MLAFCSILLLKTFDIVLLQINKKPSAETDGEICKNLLITRF